MKPFPTHRKRPTIDDARQAIKDGIVGGWSPTDFPNAEQRKEMVDSLAADLSETVERNSPETDNVEYAILKCHLLVEHVLERFIECMSQYSAPNVRRFTFSHKLDIASMLGFGANCMRTIPSIEMLNRVRNQVAHRFEIDIEILDELHRWWAEDPDDVDDSSDEDRIQFLLWFCAFTAGSVAGRMEAATVMLHPEEYEWCDNNRMHDESPNHGFWSGGSLAATAWFVTLPDWVSTPSNDVTFQEPNLLRNDSDVDLTMLHAYNFCDVHGDNASDTAYLPVQPKFPTPNELCTSLWRGFIATLYLHCDGSLELVKFDFPYSSAKPSSQIVNERFAGDFSILFRPFFPGPNTIVPFRSGLVSRDRSEWLVDDQTMTAFVDDVFGDSGLRVTVCDLPGFIPRSCLPERMRDCLHDLIGSEIACRLLRCDGRHPAVYIAAELEDGG